MKHHMFIITVTCLLLAAPIIFIIVSGRARRRKKKQLLLDTLDSVAKKEQLYITERMLWRNRILGIDRINRKIVQVISEGTETIPQVIDLSEVGKCELLQQKSNQIQISAVLLALIFHDKTKPSLHIPFYEERNDGVYEMKSLTERAVHWQNMIVRTATVKAF
jgi:hypothetical protein